MSELEEPKTETSKLVPRMKNPGEIFPEIVKPLQDLYGTAFKGGVSPKTLALVHLRVSQLNGCSFCVTSGSKDLVGRGEASERIYAVAAWRDAPFYTDAERAALELAEHVTRLSDRSDPVPDDVWNRAREHYDERGMAALLIVIAASNVFNRLNVPTRTLASLEQNW